MQPQQQRHAANGEARRQWWEELKQRSVAQPVRPPGWVVLMVAALVGLALLLGWLVWRDLELAAASGAVVLVPAVMWGSLMWEKEAKDLRKRLERRRSVFPK